MIKNITPKKIDAAFDTVRIVQGGSRRVIVTDIVKREALGESIV